jgi:predicted N-formylglutamate amidohydrolase
MQSGQHKCVEQAGAVVEIINPNAINLSFQPIILVCEHASNFIPEELNDLGLDLEILESHVAWDIGAYQLAKNISKILNAALISSKISRLIYDCNRAPVEISAIPEKCEEFEILGNKTLSSTEREERVTRFYRPFYELLEKTITSAMINNREPIIVTIHTFTPKYFGKFREVEIGIIHDRDSRFADNVLDVMAEKEEYNVKRNEPYGPKDAVTHTLKEHAIKNGLLNVMIEVRNDLVTDEPNKIASFLSKGILAATKNILQKKGREHA